MINANSHILSNLDSLTDGGFLPYRDSDNRPRLLDVSTPSQASKKARPLYQGLLKTLRAAVEVQDQDTYRTWYFTHVEPLHNRIDAAKLGMCMGDEGLELRDRLDQISSLVHQPGWRIED